MRTLEQTKRDHGYYWVIDPTKEKPVEQLAEWAYLSVAGKEVWLLTGDENYGLPFEFVPVSRRISEPREPFSSKIRDRLGLRDERRNTRVY